MADWNTSNDEESFFEAPPSRGPVVIQRQKLVIGEGIEEERFFPKLLKFYGRGINRPNLGDSLQFLNCGGKNRLKGFLSALVRQADFNGVNSIGIVVDADDDLRANFQSVIGALESLSLPTPSAPGQPQTLGNLQVVIWVLPDNASQGELEDLCLEALKNHPLIPCVDSLISCATSILPDQTSSSSKAKVYSWLACWEPPGRRLGELRDEQLNTWDLSVFQRLVNGFFLRL